MLRTLDFHAAIRAVDADRLHRARRRLAQLVEHGVYYVEVAGDRLAAWLDPDDLEPGQGVPHPSPDTVAARLAAGERSAFIEYNLRPVVDRLTADLAAAVDEGLPRPVDEEIFEPFVPPVVLHDAVLDAFPDKADTVPGGWAAHLRRTLPPRRLEGAVDWPEVADVDPPWRSGELAREWRDEAGGWHQARRPGGVRYTVRRPS
jgi:hypothetical protein